jgi:hypothetical protein
MDAQQRFDACMKQADFYFRSFDTRRQYEWKVTFGIWTLAAVGIAFLPRLAGITPVEKSFLAVFLVLLHVAWTFRIVQSNWKDAKRAWGFREIAERILKHPPDASTIVADLPVLPVTKIRRTSDVVFASLPVLGTLILVGASFMLPAPRGTGTPESLELHSDGGEVHLSVPK